MDHGVGDVGASVKIGHEKRITNIFAGLTSSEDGVYELESPSLDSTMSSARARSAVTALPRTMPKPMSVVFRAFPGGSEPRGLLKLSSCTVGMNWRQKAGVGRSSTSHP